MVTLENESIKDLNSKVHQYPDTNALFYIEMDSYKIASIPSYIIDDNAIVFDNFYFLGMDEIDSDYEFISRLIVHLFHNKEENIVYNFYLEDFIINQPITDKFKYSFGVLGDTKWNKYIKSKESSFSELFWVEYGSARDDNIDFHYNLSDNNNLNQFSESVKNVYQQLNLDQSTYRKISFIYHNDKTSKCFFTFKESLNNSGYALDSVNVGLDSEITLITFLEELKNDDFWNQKITEYMSEN